MCRWCDADDNGEDGEAEMIAEGVEQLLDWASHAIESGHHHRSVIIALQVALAQAEASFGGHVLN